MTTAGETQTTGEPETTVEPESTSVSLLDEKGEAVYKIIRPDQGSDSEVDTGKNLKKALKELTGADFSISSDFLMPNQSIEDVNNEYEILIGATNRPESIAAREGLTTNEYVIRVIGAKIVIVGSSDLMTARAAEKFISILGAENNFTLSKDTDIKEEIERGQYLVALTNQGKSLLEVYDISEGNINEESLVWSYKMPYYNIAGTKLRHSEVYGDVALAVCGGSYGCMISYPEGKLLWYTNTAANNPHSIELIPNGVIAIASSTGGEIRFFKTDKNISRTFDAKMPLEDAHGVLWDPENNVLWAIGGNVLTAYSVTVESGNVTVTEVSALRDQIPSNGAHDLAPVYGNKDELWITTSSHVYRYNKKTRSFTTDYTGNELLDRSGVKGIGNFDDGSCVYIYPDGMFKSWTSRTTYFLTPYSNQSKAMVSSDGHFYKIRVWDVRYQ
jgi:hypothetical protein